MFQRTTDVIMKVLQDELLRLARIDRNWVELEYLPDQCYKVSAKHPTWTRKLWESGPDGLSMWAASIWLLDGPKVFCPTTEQCKALEQIEVRLQLHEYAQPYPAILIGLPEGYEPFENVLCFFDSRILVCTVSSRDHLHDITTTVAVDGRPIEVSLQKFDDDCREDSKMASRVLRIACNSCLALVNYGCLKEYLYPKEVERDRKLAQENTERGAKARERLKTKISLVRFEHNVVLHNTERPNQQPGEPTGREVGSHWRRGHWAMQPYGPSRSLRKRILRKPTLVRADKFIGEKSDFTTVYRTGGPHAEGKK